MLSNNNTPNNYLAGTTGAALEHVVALSLHEEVLHDFIQQTALQTPQQNTTTKTTFKPNSIHSFQQLHLSQLSIYFPFYC